MRTMSDSPASTPTVEVPADLPRNPGDHAQRRTETYLAAVAAAKAAPSRQTYGFIGSCCHGHVMHQLAHVGSELLHQAVVYTQAANDAGTA
jgi:hypothetical protein